MSNKLKRLLIAASLLLTAFSAWANVEVPRNTEHAWQAPHVAKSLLLSIAGRGEQAIWVAGERGHILKQSGSNEWRQSSVPTQILLTAIDMFDDQHGWAVGHDAVILKTMDGGASWQEVYKNVEEQRPLFDVTFRDLNNGVAVGAYGYYLYTHDGGKTWKDKLVNEEHDYHLNAISKNSQGDLYIAGETGHIYRSLDKGENWTTLSSPYEGSFFDVLAWGDSHVAVAGLRGHLYLSDDKGESWNKIPSTVQTSLNSIIRLKNGQLLTVGHAGMLLLTNTDFSQTSTYQLAERKALSDVYEFKQNQVLLVGEAGVSTINLCTVFQPEAVIGCEHDQ
jgi:photosystem II stability/assembly factor-like uncharacterized protein